MNSGEQNLWSVKPNTGLAGLKAGAAPRVQTTGLATVIVPIHVRAECPKKGEIFQPTHIS